MMFSDGPTGPTRYNVPRWGPLALLAIMLVLWGVELAYSQTGTAKDKSAVSTEIGANFPDNTSGLITPLITRNSLQDFLSSWQGQRRVNSQTGTSYTFTTDDSGKLVKFGNAAAVAVTLPVASTTNFVAWETIACNTGAGIVTVTPTTSTINGNTTQTLTNGSCISIVSDGTNYQTETFTWQPTVNAQTGTTYTIAVSDYGNMVTFSNGASIAVTLPQATGAFKVFSFWACAIGAGTATITPTVSTINGAASVALATNACIYIVSDGVNYRYTTASSPGKPTIQSFTTGTNATYTTPGGVTYIEVFLVGGGGGGGSSGAGGGAGGNGGDTCWKASGTACTTPLYDAGGGAGGEAFTTGNGGAGGTVSGSATCNVLAVAGGGGSSEIVGGGGPGGSSSIGGGAKGQSVTATGNAGATNSGGGGSGGGAGTGTAGSSGGGGATCKVLIVAPAASYVYTVGAGGAGGTGGANSNGGAGAAGVITVVEHYGS